MSHKALYRRARPRTFGEVVGQGTQVSAITSAIVEGSLPETILLSGHLGCGKTTIARLIAASINCEYREEGSAEPCGGSNPDCQTCPGVIDGEKSVAVTELDAAQNRSIDAVRELIEAMNFRVAARHKVFIIDEAHRLTKDAASALLKTLEEPPPGVIIIMATTEPQALIGTVRSRLRQYSLSSLSDDDLDKVLTSAAERFDIELSDSDLRAIKSRADSSGRNALSILERLSQNDGESLGDDTPLFLRGITDSIADESVTSVLVLIQQRINAGGDVAAIQQVLAAHFRNALIAKESPNSLEITGDTLEEAQYAAETLSLRALLEIFGAVTNAARPGTPDARVALEVGIMGVIYKMKGVGSAPGGLSKKDLELIVNEVKQGVVEEISELLEDRSWPPVAETESKRDEKPEPADEEDDEDAETEDERDTAEPEDGESSDDEESPLDSEDATLPPPSDDDKGGKVQSEFNADEFLDVMIKSVSTRRDEIFLTRHAELKKSSQDDDTLILVCKNGKQLSDSGWDAVDDSIQALGWFLKEDVQD